MREEASHEKQNNGSRYIISSDLWYIFNTLNRSWRPFTKDDEYLASEISAYLSAFAKKGNPNSSSLPAWNPYKPNEKYIQVFDVSNRMEDE
ncbi:carboxylesterase family protein [Faecalicatena contorta]|uniref:carboxylesterase family protein n=1 Tax=Faecalicatena contorta TaxID=39482 RepID=UPI0018977547